MQFTKLQLQRHIICYENNNQDSEDVHFIYEYVTIKTFVICKYIYENNFHYQDKDYACHIILDE